MKTQYPLQEPSYCQRLASRTNWLVNTATTN